MIPTVRLCIAMVHFVGFSFLREVRGVNAAARGDREDCEGGETGENLLLLADGVVDIGVVCDTNPV